MEGMDLSRPTQAWNWKLAARERSWKSISIEAARTREPCRILLNLLYARVLEDLASCTDQQWTSWSITFPPLQCYSIQVLKKRCFTFLHYRLFPNPMSVLTVTCHTMAISAFNFGNSALFIRLYTAVLKGMLPSNISVDKIAVQKAKTRLMTGGWTDLHHAEDMVRFHCPGSAVHEFCSGRFVWVVSRQGLAYACE